ncbi:helix-turn-helix protein [Tamaricihabitans halophyticus]|uniref:Helix-turn-helix protein n=1 Tax=Tamaricihabitans halophyticus TaxID=1262583 RepID=A0A4R2QJ32_9PSEU|nr:helix-turn-helix transcriptional regulator [Tamaricihabitans halophyticus]TCP48488.1 helix-turn-helix protein [Tamaricihabitans halophyticus]
MGQTAAGALGDTDNALGAFLRARREGVPPSAVGLPSDPARRTPGLRRAELAELAGMSVDYLTRLERGADRRPSPQVLGALADVLRLTEDEHVHLLRLVKAGGGMGCTGETPPAPRPSLCALLDQLEPAPAVLLNRCGDILARTEGFRVFGVPEELTNLPQFVFTNTRARRLLPDWDVIADEWAARLRAAVDLGDPYARLFATELALRVGAEFVARYDRATRVPMWTGTERWADSAGVIRDWRYEALGLPETEEHRLLVYLPG